MRLARQIAIVAAIVAVHGLATAGAAKSADSMGPYDCQVQEQTAQLRAGSAEIRVRAAEALGLLRAAAAEPALRHCLSDPEPAVRRAAALSLGWCGGRKAVAPLLDSLQDENWMVRQSAHVALTNLTGMEFPFSAMGTVAQRAPQVAAWRAWWSRVPDDRAPDDVLRLLVGPKDLAQGARVTASSTYRGPLDVLVEGRRGPQYWQTKNVPFPQWCQLDLGRARRIDQVVVHQYGPGFCMTEYELATSVDGKRFERVIHRRGLTPVDLAMSFPARSARYVRITSLAAERKLYPTTFFQIEVFDGLQTGDAPLADVAWRQERGARALGVLGGRGATEAILELLGPTPSTAERDRTTVRAAIRALGRRGDEASLQALLALLDQPLWARYAAEALGDLGDRRAVSPLLSAYARYAKRLDGNYPADVPADDRMSFPSEDRMLETPYAIAYALGRLPLDRSEDRETLRRLAPQIMANLPSDFDSFVLYEPEVYHRLTRHLMERSGLRQAAADYALVVLGQSAAPDGAARKPSVFHGILQVTKPLTEKADYLARAATWLPAVCTDKKDLPRLLPLLEHDNGWVRIYAAKTLAWLGDRRAIEPIARVLREAKAEADYGYASRFKDEEFNDPCPRWREALIRALGILGARECEPLLTAILNDERSVLEVRHAAAEALADLGSPQALEALRSAALHHSFLSVRHICRDALCVRGEIDPEEDGASASLSAERPDAPSPSSAAGFFAPAEFDAFVFIKGDNNLPTTWKTADPEQADRWRQTYVVTDEGPSYRPGDNLYVLRPPRPDGRVTPLTRFADGYVAEPEVSWDGRQVVFTHRTADNPWWQVWVINVDGTGLRCLTRGPYHHVGPAFLPDGQIVLASSRSGIRDEYHGYPCTALYVMNADGSDLHPIATNIGRDNEPAVLPDGRIVFSRLEVFYSRNKTELTLHAVHPDGAQDVVLYGPERRTFWRNLDHGLPGPDDGQESPLTHRVLRITQPQPMADGRHVIVSTQGGLVLIGPRRDTEQLLMPDFKVRAYSTPFPLADGSILCASTLKTSDRMKVDLGIYRFYPATGRLELIYNDPATADYEARPVVARRAPPAQPTFTRRGAYGGRFLCASVFDTQEAEVRQRGRLVRLIEGVPVVARHQTHTGREPVWKNHGGTFARVLGTIPLAPDGSFFADVPADRLMHWQVLDSDRRVVGNQRTWIYSRPGETKSCAGCHEHRHTSPPTSNPLASHDAPVKLFPTGHDFTYRAKAWFKGALPPEVDERSRTVHAVNLLGRP